MSQENESIVPSSLEGRFDAEGVPPGPDLDTCKKFLISEEELFEDLDKRVAREIPDQRQPKKIGAYIKKHGLDVNKINSKSTSEHLKADQSSINPENGPALIEEELPRPNTEWLPEDFQVKYEELEKLIEQLLIDAIVNTPPGQVADAQHRAERLRNEIRRTMARLEILNPGPHQIGEVFKAQYKKIQEAKK